MFGDSTRKVINAFKVDSFENYLSLEGEFTLVLKNLSGTKYDIFGSSSNGSSLEKPDFAYVAIWKVWLDFYENFEFEE